VQAAFTCLVQGLTKIDDLDVHILKLKPAGWTGTDEFDHNGAQIHLMPSIPRFERLRRYHTYQSIFNKVLSEIQPTLVHAQEATSDAYVAIRSGFPTLVTAHGIRREDAKYTRSLSRRLRFGFDGFMIERSVIRQVRYLIAISHYITNYFAPLFRSDIRLSYIPNAVDESYFHLEDGTHKPVVLFAGRVTPLKRVLDLVQAFEQIVHQIPSAQLRIAGECHTETAYVQAIDETIQRSHMESNVHLLGELKQTDMLQEYSSCSILALPSSQENAPMVIAQAMAARKPVVATPVGGIPEMLGKSGERGLLSPVGDIDKLADNLLYLLYDDTLRQQMGWAGHLFALENYQSHQVAERTASVYREIALQEGAIHG
jgi:glycosyltransferase involved in cell wall biosynthesis